jgi:hypothetical protein
VIVLGTAPPRSSADVERWLRSLAHNEPSRRVVPLRHAQSHDQRRDVALVEQLLDQA